jgi:acyl-CoA synthetase (AMP-forming)/AMP-acid ligase II
LEGLSVGEQRLPPYFSPRTIPELLRERARAFPRKLGFVARSCGGDYRGVTFGEWDALSDSLASWLASVHRIGEGSRVAWLFGNDCGAEALALFHAVLKVGALNIPINVRLTIPEIRHVLNHSEAALCLAGGRGMADEAQRAAAALPCPVEGVEAAGDWYPSAGRAVPVSPALNDVTDASVLYTSGTTGLPRGVLHTHGSSLSAGIGWADAFRLLPEDVLQSPFPIFSGAGLHFNGLSALWAGATFVVEDYETDVSLRLIDEHRSTVYAAVPSIYQYWLDSPILDGISGASLRLLDYGGASMPPAVIQRLKDRFPLVGLMQTYGLTEAGPGGLYLAEEYAMAHLGSVGNRGAGRFTEFRVVDDAGADVGPDGIGECVLRGPSLMKGYYKDPEGTAAIMRDGWLKTGDVVRIDETGFVYHLDRKKDIIVRGGFNIASAEVEAALLDHPAVAEVAVVARPHPKLGEEPVAFVVARIGHETDPSALVAHCASRLADFKLPRRVVFVAELPKNAAGKVLKRVLRDELWSTSGQGVV